MTLLSGLQTITFGGRFNRSLGHVTLLSGLQTITFSIDFDQALEHLTLPSDLQRRGLGHRFEQRPGSVILPRGLQSRVEIEAPGFSSIGRREGEGLPSGMQQSLVAEADNEQQHALAVGGEAGDNGDALRHVSVAGSADGGTS